MALRMSGLALGALAGFSVHDSTGRTVPTAFRLPGRPHSVVAAADIDFSGMFVKVRDVAPAASRGHYMVSAGP